MVCQPSKKMQVLEAVRAGTAITESNFSDSDEDLSERTFEVGQWIDARDTSNDWLEAQILEVGDHDVLVHFDGWASKWDERISKSSSRIARFGSNTRNMPRREKGNLGPRLGDNLGYGVSATEELLGQLSSAKTNAMNFNMNNTFTNWNTNNSMDDMEGGY